MNGLIKFSCTSLRPGQKGIVRRREDGAYVTPVGGLNVLNSAGQRYVYEEARGLFERSSQFMRRVSKGNLKGEVGHPKPQPGMTEDGYLNRILSIEETNICCLHKEIWLDFDSVRDERGNPVIAIMSAVVPSGPKGDFLGRAFETAGDNVNFSIRAFTDDYMSRGVVCRILRQIVTFDYVTEPGIGHASKFNAPSMEHLVERQFTDTMVRRVATANTGVAQESAVNAHDLLNAMGYRMDDGGLILPKYMKW